MNIQIDTVNYLNLTVPPEIVADTLNIEVSSHAYLPKTDDPESDWVASVAVPAFKLIRKRYGHPVPSFCSIGTGSGLDVLAAIELLGADHVGFTDLQSEVVETAAKNITNNLRKGKKVIMAYGAGEYCSHRYRDSKNIMTSFTRICPMFRLTEVQALPRNGTAVTFWKNAVNRSRHWFITICSTCISWLCFRPDSF